jgi:deoxycytidylate deaminase
MNTKISPAELATTLLRRSSCAVQVAAVLQDRFGVFAWGWNSSGPTGYGQHAEAHAISRANPHRLMGATLWVAARRRRNGRTVTARPCEECQRIIHEVGRIIYRDGNGIWCG